MHINLVQNKNFKLFKTLSKVAQDKGVSLYVVGGYVRDLLLERVTPTDIDFVTESSGISLAESAALELLGSAHKVSVFKTYGTAMFRYQNLDLEFVGARKESYTKTSRNPQVQVGTLEDDQLRRDFTINAMAISLNTETFGDLIDPFAGLDDLQNKLIRTPSNPLQTFTDDPLRMMRAVRFACTLDFTLDPKAVESIKQESSRLTIVSKERIMTEFNKIMQSDKPSRGLKLLDTCKLLDLILPELTALKGVEEVEGLTHKDNFYHTLEVLDNISVHTSNLWLRWSALLHDVGKAPTKKFVEGTGWTFHGHEYLGSKMAKTIFQRLKLPLGNDLKYVQKMVRLSSRPIALVTDDTSDSALRRMLFDAGEDLEDLFTLCKADITTKNAKKQKHFKKNFDYVAEKIRLVEQKDHLRNFQPPVSGEEIMRLFNLSPGREVGILKEKIKESILEGTIGNSREEALGLLMKLAQDLGLSPQH